MKKVWIGGIALLLSAQYAVAQQPFRIEGKLNGIQGDRVVRFRFYDGKQRVEDSTFVRNGQFSYTGKLTNILKAFLTMDVLHPKQKPADSMTTADYMRKSISTDKIMIYVDAGVTTIVGKDSLKTATVKGGKTQSDLALLDASEKPAMDEMLALYRKKIDAVEADDSIAVERIGEAMAVLETKLNTLDKDFIRQHPDSYVSWDLLRDMGGIIDLPVFEPLFNNMSARLRNTKEGKELAARIEKAKRTAIGQPAPVFTQNDASGKPFNLASLRGKYVLVDFWASWCGPCRGENPNVLKAYNRFHDKNLEIISVSVDDNKDAWLKAVQEDGLPWVQVSDLQGMKNNVAAMYGITAVPQNFLVDPSGMIIARNLRGDALMEELAKHLK
jgi:peroxiredoxin